MLGAEILEFHFTDTRRGKKFRDHKISLIPDETRALINKIKKINILKGSNIKAPTKSEIKSNNIKTFRRAIYLKRDLKKKELIKKDDLICLRPNNGVDARQFKKLIGKRVLENTPAFKKIKI